MNKTAMTITGANLIQQYDEIEISSAIIKGRKILSLHYNKK